MPDLYHILQSASIAVVRTDRLGDMVLTLPLCNAIKSEFPQSKVTLIANSYTKLLLENCPVVDEVIFVDDKSKNIKSVFKENKFDFAFFPRPRFGEVLAAFKGGVKFRIGSAYRAYSFLYNKKVFDHRKKGEFHEAEYNVRLLSQLIGMELPVNLVKPFISNVSKEFIKNLLNKNNIQEKGFIILHPGSGGSSRDWKSGSFAELAKLISERTGFGIIVTGIKSEKESCNLIANVTDRVLNLCGILNQEQLIALLSTARILIANSTGVLHIAAALGVPVVGLFPNTSHISARRWGPYSANSSVVSPPTGDKANIDNMDLISPETVFESAMILIED